MSFVLCASHSTERSAGLAVLCTGSLRAFLQILFRQQRLRHRAPRARGLLRHLPGERDEIPVQAFPLDGVEVCGSGSRQDAHV